MYHRKPVINLGTLGVKANVQIIVPFLTESYYSTDNDPPKTSVSIDIILNFSHKIEHTIEWAHQKFIELFKEIPEQAQKYLLNTRVIIEDISKNCSPYYIDQRFNNINQILGKDRPKTFVDCIKWVDYHFVSYKSKLYSM